MTVKEIRKEKGGLFEDFSVREVEGDEETGEAAVATWKGFYCFELIEGNSSSENVWGLDLGIVYEVFEVAQELSELLEMRRGVSEMA